MTVKGSTKLTLLVAALALMAAACGGHNRAVDSLGAPVLTVSVPAGMPGGTQAQWAVSWQGGRAPYTIEASFGGGAADIAAGTPAASPFSRSLLMRNDSRSGATMYIYTFRVTDANGASGVTSGSYEVGAYVNQPPQIGQLTWDPETLTLGVPASDGDPGETELTVSVTPPAGAWAIGDTPDRYAPADAPAERLIPADGSTPATFSFFNRDPAVAAAGSVAIDVTDGFGASAHAQFTLHLPSFILAPDTLYAMPAQRVVKVGEPVMVIVATGVPAQSFYYMDGVGLVTPEDSEAINGSENYGAIGGTHLAVDGFWSALAPSDFLVWMYPATASVIIFPPPMGPRRWDYSIAPVGGHDVTTDSGALFNVQFTFATPGVKSFSFVAVDGIDRTYYSDSVSNHYFWSDISNVHEGIPSSVTVVE